MADETDEDEDLPSYRVVYVVPRAAGGVAEGWRRR